MHDVAILIPAAGASARMGGCDKLLQEVEGAPLLLRQVSMALTTGAQILVTLPPEHTARRQVLASLSDRSLSLMTVPDAAEGMSASLRAGARWAQAQKARGLMIVLPDMPEIEARDIKTMLRTFQPGQVLRAFDSDGVGGHPVIIPARLYEAVCTLTGDRGARDLLMDEKITPLPLAGHRATTDLDTPEDWAKWRRETTRR